MKEYCIKRTVTCRKIVGIVEDDKSSCHISSFLTSLRPMLQDLLVKKWRWILLIISGPFIPNRTAWPTRKVDTESDLEAVQTQEGARSPKIGKNTNPKGVDSKGRRQSYLWTPDAVDEGMYSTYLSQKIVFTKEYPYAKAIQGTAERYSPFYCVKCWSEKIAWMFTKSQKKWKSQGGGSNFAHSYAALS